jgi:hypothetical protein
MGILNASRLAANTGSPGCVRSCIPFDERRKKNLAAEPGDKGKIWRDPLVQAGLFGIDRTQEGKDTLVTSGCSGLSA